MKHVYIAKRAKDDSIGVTKCSVVYENSEQAIIIVDGNKKPFIIDKKSIIGLNTPEADEWFYKNSLSRWSNHEAIFIENPTNHIPSNIREVRLKNEIRELEGNIRQHQNSIQSSLKYIKDYQNKIDSLNQELESLKGEE